MYRGRYASFIAIATIFTMIAVSVIAPVMSDDSSADMSGTQINITELGSTPIEVNAGSSAEYKLLLTSNYSDTRAIAIDAYSSNDYVTVYVNDFSNTISSKGYETITIVATADKFTHQGEYSITLKVTVKNIYDSSLTPDVGTYTVSLDVQSNLSSSEQYNRFMGIWDNTLPSPFDGAWFSALVTGLIWLAIGFAVRFVAVPVVMKLIMKREDPDYEAMRTALVRMCFVIVVLNAIGKAIRVFGVSESLINTINVLFYVCYIIVGVIVIWRFYVILVNVIVKKIGVRDFIPGGSKSDFESLKPLFMYIGEIILSVAAVGSVMSLLGFNMTAIITSAGIISLGITMGAQSVLSQFFSGLVILSTRPFKVGDLVTINGSSITYRVRKVNVMFTEFENWDNTDISIVPNSTLTSGIIKNITRDTLKSKIHIFIDVAYGTDLAYARGAMLEVANANPRVIKDGSVGRPSTRVTEFEDSNIQLRLSVYVDDFNDSGVIGGELRQALYNKFNEKGINIDYTQIVVRPVDPKEDDKN